MTAMLTRRIGVVLSVLFLSLGQADVTDNKHGTDNKSTKLASDDLIDLDESVANGNESIIESSKGKIIFEPYPTKLQAAHDITSDDADGLAGSGSGTEEEGAVNVTESPKLSTLPNSEVKHTTTVPVTTTEDIQDRSEESDEVEDDDDDDDDDEDDEDFDDDYDYETKPQATTTPKWVQEKTTIDNIIHNTINADVTKKVEILKLDTHEDEAIQLGHAEQDQKNSIIDNTIQEVQAIGEPESDKITRVPSLKELCETKNCQYGGKCVLSGVQMVTCECPVSECENELAGQICGSDGTVYPSLCHLAQQACATQQNITQADYKVCAPYEMPCEDLQEPSWAVWSIWLQSGSNDFRFRYCKVGEKVVDSHANCGNDLIEVRPCKRQRSTECRTSGGLQGKEFNYACSGTSLQDMTSIDQLFNGKLEKEVECTFSLYDAGLQKFVHKDWPWEMLQKKGDPFIWCSHRGIFVPFISEQRSCKKKLERFCTSIKAPECKPRKKVIKSKGELKHKCWKKFFLDGAVPQGFPNLTEKYYICQRFAPDTDIADVFGEKSTHFGTIYDSASRTPLMSFVRFKDIGDESWPVIPYMIEKGLLPSGYSILSMFFDQKRKGMLYKNFKKEGQTIKCESGLHQALESDYKDSRYRMIQLLPPGVVGYDVGTRMATFALTNTVPIHASLYSIWRQTNMQIRKFAMTTCNIPEVFNADQKKKRRQSHDYPEVYVISGAVPSTNPEKLLNDRVNVPYLVWSAVCCVRGADTSSFSVYVRNDIGSPVIVAPVVQLEVLLSDLYNSENQPSVKLFPAFGGVCSDIQHDVSQAITM